MIRLKMMMDPEMNAGVTSRSSFGHACCALQPEPSHLEWRFLGLSAEADITDGGLGTIGPDDGPIACNRGSIDDRLRPRPMTLHDPTTARAHPPQRADATSLTMIAAILFCDSAASSAADLNGRRSPVQRICTRSSGTLLA
jgi:hypothetical protein